MGMMSGRSKVEEEEEWEEKEEEWNVKEW